MSVKLAHHPIASTKDAEEGEAILSQEMSPLRFEKVRDPKRFGLTMNGVKLGETMIGYNRFDTETEVDAGEVEHSLIFTLSIGPPAIPSIDGIPIGPKQGAITSPGKQLAIHRSEGSEILILRTSKQSIKRHFERSLDASANMPIRFETHVDLDTEVGFTAKNVLVNTIDQISNDPAILSYPLIRKGFDELLLSTFLTLPSNYSALIAKTRQQNFAPSLVRAAEEFIAGNGSQAIGISEVAKACNCGRRALFAAFRRHRQYTPMQFLEEVRLKRARTLLLNPNPSATVTSISKECGFLHGGRFSKRYFQRYGESPSETLRRASR